MKNYELNETELAEVSGGIATTLTYIGVIASIASIVDFADQAIQGYNDHRKED